MANSNQRNKNAVVAVAGLAFNEQSSNPIASSDQGLYFDSNGVPHLLAAGIERGVAALSGIIPAARLAFATDASNADSITIGGHEFRFLTTLVAANTYTQVKRGTSAAQTLADLVKAINGTTSANVVQATTPFSASIVADAVDATHLRIRKASSRGGTAIAGTSTSIALAESLTPAASIWNCANLNVAGKAATDYQCSSGVVAITASMVTYGSFQIELPFTPTAFVHMCSSSTGVQRAIDDAITISGNAINVALAGGASPNIQAGDLFRFFAVA